MAKSVHNEKADDIICKTFQSNLLLLTSSINQENSQKQTRTPAPSALPIAPSSAYAITYVYLYLYQVHDNIVPEKNYTFSYIFF